MSTRLVETYVELNNLSATLGVVGVGGARGRASPTVIPLLLLDDRGWSVSGPPNIWQKTSAGEIADMARVVVGPDEAFDGYSQEEMEANHWGFLAAVLRCQGADIEVSALGALPHDVVLGDELL